MPVALAVAASLLLAAAPEDTGRPEEPAPPASRTAPAAPTAPAAVAPAEALREADLAFARAVAAKDRAAFADLVDPEAVFGGGAQLREGRAAVVEAWSAFFVDGGPRLAWAPDDAALSASGDLGYTIGHSRLERTEPDGTPTVTEGRYLTVWRRGADGRFRALMDLSYEPDAAKTIEGTQRRVARRARSAAGDLAAEMGTWSRAHGGGGPASGAYLAVTRRGADRAMLPERASATTFRGGK